MTGGDQWNCTEWSQEDTDEFVGKMIVGPVVGIALGAIMVILASLPLCCGVMKAQGRIIAMIGIPVGILACLMPLFLSMNGCGTFIDNLCTNCEDDNGNSSCDQVNPNSPTDKTFREEIDEGCHALGFLVAYLLAYGWAAVVLGITAAALSCCILCGCCKMKDDGAYADGGAQTSA